MVGKKKQRDIQFFTEVLEASQSLDNRRRSNYDPDEHDEEQRDRALRRRLNEMFKKFCDSSEEVASAHKSSLQFDAPYKELSFKGTPFKEMTSLMPTANCLVNLSEWPSFVVPLDEIEHVHFEGVIDTKRDCDMVLIFKDYNRTVATIRAIEMRQLSAIREWLTDIDITCTQGPKSFVWKEIIKTVQEQGEHFWMDADEDGVKKDIGWSFLSADMPDSDEEGDSDLESNFSDEDIESAESSDDDDESDEEMDDEESDDDDDLDDEEGLDWDEMEQQAAADDRKRNRDEKERERMQKSQPAKRRRR